jgi:hypothetical protein
VRKKKERGRRTKKKKKGRSMPFLVVQNTKSTRREKLSKQHPYAFLGPEKPSITSHYFFFFLLRSFPSFFMSFVFSSSLNQCCLILGVQLSQYLQACRHLRLTPN